MLTILKTLGLDIEKDLSTADITSDFKFYLFKNKDVLKTKLFTLKVKDAVTASQVFIKLEETGISNTSIERVDHSDLENIRNMMRSNAMSNAKSKATLLTKTLNQVLGPAIHITEGDNPGHLLQGRMPGIQIRGASTLQNGYKEVPKIEFEKIKVTANVSAKFILR
jgi:uncharacterized protein YggE